MYKPWGDQPGAGQSGGASSRLVQGGTYSPLLQGTQTSYRKSPDGSSSPVEYGRYPSQPPQQPQQGGQGGYGSGPGYSQQPGSGGSPGGGHYGSGPGSTTPPGQTPGTATGPLFSKADTDQHVSQSAAKAFGAADPYSLKIAGSGNGLSYGAGQASMMQPLLSQAGTAARTAAKTIPLGDAMANESWMLGNQTQQAQNALDWARLGEYRNQTGQMNDDFFTELLMKML